MTVASAIAVASVTFVSLAGAVVGVVLCGGCCSLLLLLLLLL